MELRTILYGYGKLQFKFFVIEEEARIVKRIFEEYISGKTLLQIGNALTEEGVVYYRDRTYWSKQAVRRILENSHYIGDKDYPAIIDRKTFKTANSIRLEKGGDREKDSPEIHYLKYCTICSQCGGRYTRRNHYSGQREAWYCVNGCKKSRYVDDKSFIGDVISIINKAIAEPELLIKPCSTENMYNPTAKIIRDEHTLGELVRGEKMTFTAAKKMYFDLVNEQFDCCVLDKSAAVTDALISYIGGFSEISEINPEFMKVIISKIIVDERGFVAVKFANDAVVKTEEREDENGKDQTEY